MTDGGSAGFEKKRSKWCAPSGIHTTPSEEEAEGGSGVLGVTPPKLQGSRPPLLNTMFVASDTPFMPPVAVCCSMLWCVAESISVF